MAVRKTNCYIKFNPRIAFGIWLPLCLLLVLSLRLQQRINYYSVPNSDSNTPSSNNIVQTKIRQRYDHQMKSKKLDELKFRTMYNDKATRQYASLNERIIAESNFNADPTQFHDQMIWNTVYRKKLGMKESVDCAGIIKGERNAQTEAKWYLDKYPSLKYSDAMMARDTHNCAAYLERTHYPRKPLTQSEAEYPIAYSIVAHRDAFQLEKLLRAIYWPQNWYCVHIDMKANKALVSFVSNLAKCLPNVLVPRQRESVIYGGFSRLKADITCMEKLLNSSRTWEYVINLTGQEFPLRTNAEIVKVVKLFNLTNDIKSVSESLSRLYASRYSFHWEVNSKNKLVRTKYRKSPPPGNITIIKGSAFGAFTREFIEFALIDSLAQEYLAWLADTWSPDEAFWSTLNSKLYNPMLNAPGGFGGPPESKMSFAKFVVWPQWKRQGNYIVPDSIPCRGIKIHSSCVFSYLDLPNIVTKKQLFVNKFYINYDYLAIECLEEWLHNRTYFNRISLDYDIYH